MTLTTEATEPRYSAAIEPRHFRDMMGHLPTGDVVVAGRETAVGQPAGLVVGTFQSLSLESPLVTFSVARTSSSWPRIRPAGRFSACRVPEVGRARDLR